MNKMKYFRHCKSLDEVKSEYKKLAQHYLPTETNRGYEAMMTLVDREYIEISQRPKFKQQPQEVQEEFLSFPKIIRELVRLELELEMCGSWLWVSGNTYDHADKLKELGLKFSSNKKNVCHRGHIVQNTGRCLGILLSLNL